MAELLKIEGFKASNGWLDNFKERHGIVFKSVQGEAAAVDLKNVDKWRQGILSKLLAEYSPENVFNIDETGLFWRLLPDKTMTFLPGASQSIRPSSNHSILQAMIVKLCYLFTFDLCFQ